MTSDIFSWWWVAIVFASHIVLDGTHIIDWWLGLIRGRSMKRLRSEYDTPNPCARIGYDQRIFVHSMTAITWIVQVVADNTIHLLLMYIGLRWIIGA